MPRSIFPAANTRRVKFQRTFCATTGISISNCVCDILRLASRAGSTLLTGTKRPEKFVRLSSMATGRMRATEPGWCRKKPLLMTVQCTLIPMVAPTCFLGVAPAVGKYTGHRSAFWPAPMDGRIAAILWPAPATFRTRTAVGVRPDGTGSRIGRFAA